MEDDRCRVSVHSSGLNQSIESYWVTDFVVKYASYGLYHVHVCRKFDMERPGSDIQLSDLYKCNRETRTRIRDCAEGHCELHGTDSRLRERFNIGARTLQCSTYWVILILNRHNTYLFGSGIPRQLFSSRYYVWENDPNGISLGLVKTNVFYLAYHIY